MLCCSSVPMANRSPHSPPPHPPILICYQSETNSNSRSDDLRHPLYHVAMLPCYHVVMSLRYSECFLSVNFVCPVSGFELGIQPAWLCFVLQARERQPQVWLSQYWRKIQTHTWKLWSWRIVVLGPFGSNNQFWYTTNTNDKSQV